MEKDSSRHDIENTLSLEEIADIVEKYIQEDEDAPMYDGYDISVEEAEKEAIEKKVVRKNISSRESVKGNEIKEVSVNREVKKIKEQDKSKEKYKEKEKIKEQNKYKDKIKEQDKCKEKYKEKFKENEIEKARSGKKITQNKKSYEIQRKYRAVDMIMGIAVIAIIFSSGLGIYEELPNYLMISKWNGITFGDLGVPALILALCFITPVEIEFEVRENKWSFGKIALKRVKIGIILFAVGIILNLVSSGFSANFRIMGILQFVGIVYMTVSLIYIFFKRFKFKVNVIGIILTILGIIGTTGYFVISRKYGYDMKTCLASFVDSKVLVGHFIGFERFGIVSMISAIFAGLIAAAGGSFVCDRKSSNREKCIRLLMIGMVFIIISLVLEKECPYNVNIWSPSFVMMISGGIFILMPIMYVFLDTGKFKIREVISSPFVILGSSSIIIVAINEIFVNSLFKLQVYSGILAQKVELDDWIIVELLSAIFGEGTRTVVFISICIMILLAGCLSIGKGKLLKEN